MQTIDPRRLPLKTGDRLLDLGCGEGRHVHALAGDSRLSLVGLDLSPESARTALNGLQTYFPKSEPARGKWLMTRGDCRRLPFAEASFQVVICSEVLEHIADYGKVLAEMHRVLAPGGTLAVSVPRAWPERLCWLLSREYSREPGGHLRIYKAGRLKQEIEQSGFDCYARHWAHGLHSPYWWLKCLRWDKRETWAPVRLYHRFLVWDLLKAPLLTRLLERLLNPVCGKSLVLYFHKVVAS